MESFEDSIKRKVVEDKLKRLKMTVCIASICENDSTIVTATDRMVSYGEPNKRNKDNATSKIFELSKCCIALIAGEPSPSIEILEDSKKQIKENDSIRRIVDIVQIHYNDMWIKKMTQNFLNPLIKDYEDFKQRISSKSMLEEDIRKITDKINSFSLGLQIIIAGVDEKAWIYKIVDYNDPKDCICDCKNFSGYCVIGNGFHYAMDILINRYNHGLSLSECLFVIYEAKKESEKAGQIGEMTNICVINKDGIKRDNAIPIYKKLESAYDSMIKENKGIYKKHIDSLKD